MQVPGVRLPRGKKNDGCVCEGVRRTQFGGIIPLTPMRGKWTQKLILNEENKKMEKFGEGDASLVQVSALGWA